jgi:trk system potassium uptake protein TrkH
VAFYNYLITFYGNKSFSRLLSLNPTLVFLMSFFLTIIVGAILLLLPAATVSGEKTSLLGAIFTSTSATCVTGLVLYDTGTHFTFFGQMIILLLIQIGGLGIMTISTAFAILLGQRMNLQSEQIMQNVTGESHRINMKNLITNVIFTTLAFELIGSLFLYKTFSHVFVSSNKVLYYSVFHSVSAFCNAGFALMPDSFSGFYSSWNINFVISLLIIFGGLGFSVFVDLRRNLISRFTPKRFSLHTKIVLLTTFTLILLGSVLYFISEYSNLMMSFSFKDRFLASFFQSVTTRTAGFNTIDISRLSKASVFISLFLMFIGASPGSTGGGIKTTTLAVIALSIKSLVRGNKDVSAFKRKINDENIRKVMALIALSMMFLIVMIFALLLIEPFSFQKILFEAISAFGTVGLSMGITAKLSSLGQICIIILMYIGRVGPLTLIFALSERSKPADFTYIEEKISIG